MKVTIKNEHKSTEIKYPCVMQTIYDDIIVLFCQEGEGIVIQGDGYIIGSYHSDWRNTNGYWQPFTGTIELSND